MTMILNFGVLKIREVKSVYLVVKSRITVVSVIMIAILVKNWFNLEKLFETVNAQMKIMNGKRLCFVCSKITNRILFLSDYNYIRDSNNKCVLVPGLSPLIPTCDGTRDYYYMPSGYV